MKILSSLKIWQKLALVVAVLSIPIVLLAYLLVTTMNINIDFTYKEIDGARYVQQVRMMLQHFAEHRGMSNAYLSGDASFREKIMNKKTQLDEDIKALDILDAQYGGPLDSTAPWQAIKMDWKNLNANGFNLTPLESFTQHTALIKKLLDLVIHIGITSNLILDPQADSYFLIDVIVSRLPTLGENLGKMRGLSAGIVARQRITDSEKLELMKLIARSQVLREDIQNSLNLAFQYNEELKPALNLQEDSISALSGNFLMMVEQRIINSTQPDSTLTASEAFAAGTHAIEAGFTLYDAVAPEVLKLLQTRIAGLDSEKFTALATILICVVLALGFAYGFIRAIVRSLQQADTIAAAIAAGRLNSTIAVTSTDEVGHLLKSLAATQHELITALRQIKQAADVVGSGARELSQGSDNLAQRTEEQASALEETASSMEELIAAVKQNANNAGQANQLATAARSQAEQSGQVMDQAVIAMNAIYQSSHQIADIIGVIDEIASQTNLLALNAGVEAARAGDQGLGFAVVAGEVRKLAQRSADAAKEIKGLITESVTKVDDGSRLIAQSGQTLKDIVGAVKKVSDIIAEIAMASHEQASGIEQVNVAILQMDQVTQQNAALVEQASAACQSLRDQAIELQKLLEFFKLDRHHGGS